MKLRLSIPQQLLLIVVVPLGLLLMFIAALGILLNKVEGEARKTQRSLDIVAGTGRITRIGKDAAMNLVAYHISQSRLFTSNRDKLVKQIDEEITVLRELVGNDREQQQNVDMLKTATDQAVKMLARVEQRTATGDSSEVLQGILIKGEVETVINDLATAADRLADHENNIRGKSEHDEAQFRTMYEVVLLVGIPSIVIVTLACLAILITNIVNRLSILIENNMRLASGKELTPPVGGTDEIAQLDHTFREMVHARYEADKLKREFLEMVSHDVRTPLMSVSATLEMIGMGLRPQMLSSDVALAERNITQVLNLLSELLDLHRLEAGKLELALEEADVHSVITEAVETVRPNAEKLGVTVSGCDTSVQIMCDPVRLRQVLINLLSNSIKFSPKGGVVTTSVDVRTETIKITISDQGPGIPPDFREKIFERFGQVKASDSKVQGGKGLGLAICRALVEAHAGKIGVDSEPDRGSHFWIILPRIT